MRKDFFKKKKTATPKLKPGTVKSEVISVEEAEGYAPGNAVTIRYKVVDDTKVFNFSESFYLSYSERWDSFLDYVQEHGRNVEYFEDLKNLVGLREELDLAYEVRQGIRYLNVIERRFLGWAETGEGGAAL